MVTAAVSEVTVVNDVVSHLQDKRSEPEAVDLQQAFPNIRSGSYADIGTRRSMEDEHIRIDDLSPYIMGSVPNPTAFYGVCLFLFNCVFYVVVRGINRVVQVFDGHGGHEAAAYLKNNVTRLFFQNERMSQVDDVEKSLREAFLLADSALADDSSIGSSAGTTALTALLLGRLLVVANAGDCRAVLCRKGEAIDMSHDHRPTYPTERRRVEELGGFVDDGYLNGVLSVTRALGDWDMKLALGTASPLIAEPEIQQMELTEEDEFLILGCDGIWDVISSQQAVSRVRRGLRRHDDPEQCAKDLVREALRLGTYDNLTVIVVCFTSMDHFRDASQHKLKCFSISTQALYSFKNLLKK